MLNRLDGLLGMVEHREQLAAAQVDGARNT
jgi:hypothetical protein